MNWKEFFEPTWKKVILAVILAIIFTPVQFESPKCDAIDLFFGPCPYQTKTIMGLAMLEDFDRFMAFESQWAVQFIVFNALSYLVSCSVVYFSRKGKKRKGKKK